MRFDTVTVSVQNHVKIFVSDVLKHRLYMLDHIFDSKTKLLEQQPCWRRLAKPV